MFSSITFHKVFFVPIVVFAFLFSSCSKDGATGATGPQGPAGPVGPAGETGESGANLISSDWIDLTLESGIFAFVYYGAIEDARITQDILDKGMVKLYFNSGSRVYEIPNASLEGLYFTASLGKIEIFSPTKWDIDSGYRYRFVLVPE